MDYQTLIDKFFDGTTTLDEERALYGYFRSRHVAEEHEPYRTMFADWAALADTRPATRTGRAIRKNTVMRFIGAAAATAAVAAGLAWFIGTSGESTAERRYAGSYMIVDGRRIDNLNTIRPQIEKVLATADNIEWQLKHHNKIDMAENELLENIADPAERERIRTLLNE